MAKLLAPEVEKEIYAELINGKQKQDLPFKELTKRYLEHDHNWSKSRLKLNTYKLNYYLRYGYPKNKTTTKARLYVSSTAAINGERSRAHQFYQRIKGGSDYDPRDRVLSQDELKTLFDGVTPYHFNQFVRFAYYTGARSGEIRRLSRLKTNCDYMLVEGKSGRSC